MSAQEIVRSIAYLAWSEARAGLTSVRLIAIASIFGFPTVLLAYALGGSSLGGGTGTFPVWKLGPDGALLALAFGFAPILLPAVPLGLAYDVAKRDARSAYPEMLFTRSVPRWSAALGRILGLVATCSVLILIVAGASVAALSSAAGAAPSAGLVAAFLGSTLVLGAQYVVAGMLFLMVLKPSQLAWISFPLWVYNQAARPLDLVIAGQFLQILPILGPVTFVPAWSDLATFTGMAMGVIAPFAPPSGGLVAPPSVVDLGGSVAFTAVSLAGPIVVGFLVLLYLAAVSRMPLGR